MEIVKIEYAGKTVAEIATEDDKIKIATEYDAAFVDRLKRLFSEARFDANEKQWIIPLTEENLESAKKLVKDFFAVEREVICVALCKEKPVRINKMSVVEFSRDSFERRRAWNFATYAAKRFPPHGSRSQPNFHGVVLIKVALARKTAIDARGEFVVFPYTKTIHEASIEAFSAKESSAGNAEELFEFVVSKLRELEEAEREVKQKRDGIESIRKAIEEKRKQIEALQREVEELEAKLRELELEELKNKLLSEASPTPPLEVM